MRFRANPKLRFLPFFLIAIGFLIHLGAILGIGSSQISHLYHFFLLIVDGVVGYHLSQRTDLGYWLAVVFFGEQTLFQAYDTLHSIQNDWNLWWAQGITVILCFSTFMVLIKNKRIFVTLQSPSQRP